MPITSRSGIEVLLPNGATITIRPVRADDRWRVRDAFDRLSMHTRYLRFFQTKSRLTEAELTFLTEVDCVDHFALIAISMNQSNERCLGGARWIRDRDYSDIAEVSVTVIDAYQGRGIGTALLNELARTARSLNVHTFRAPVLSSNRRMLQMVARAGGRIVSWNSGIADAEIPLSTDTGSHRQPLFDATPAAWPFPRVDLSDQAHGAFLAGSERSFPRGLSAGRASGFRGQRSPSPRFSC